MNRTAAALAVACLAALTACSQSPRKATVNVPGPDPARINEAFARVVEAQDLEARGKTDEAIARYRAAVNAYREFPAAWNNLGALLLQADRRLEAAECFTAAMDLAPRDPRPAYNLALTWDRAGYLEDALRYYEKAIDRDPRFLPALRGAVRAERLLGKGDERTLDRLQTALSLEQDERWQEWFSLQKIRLESSLAAKATGQEPG